MRETRSSGSVRGASGDGRPYRARSVAISTRVVYQLDRPLRDLPGGIEHRRSWAGDRAVRGAHHPGVSIRCSSVIGGGPAQIKIVIPSE